MEPIFCPSIYKGLRILTTGQCSHCCMQEVEFKDENGNVFNVSKDKFDEIINSHTANQIRESFERGEKLPSCIKCWIEEEAGIESKRQRDIEYFPVYIPECIENPKLVELMILDVNVSNLCNLKCRTCSPSSSSLWSQESKTIFPEKTDMINSISSNIEEAYKDDSIFWNEYKTNFYKFKHIDFYGGEPFLVKKQIEILKDAVDNNIAKDISIHFNTNCTIWNNDIFNILKEFRHINLDISIDGINKRATYIRHPSDWNNIFNNFKSIYDSQLPLDHFLMSVCCSVSNLSIFYLDEVLDIVEPYVNVYLNLVYNLECFSIRCMPEELKLEVVKKIEPSLKKYNKGDKILNFMFSEKYNEKQWKFFIDRMTIYDNHRGESFRQTFLEFYELIKKYGYDYGKL